MIKKYDKRKKLIIAIGLIVLCFVGVTTVWAGLSFMKAAETGPAFQAVDESDIPTHVSRTSQARAPEPTTMVLFGGGFLGMIMGFVRRMYVVIKRIFDFCAVVFGLIILSPIFVLVALLVKLTSRGPIFYSQVRVGKNGKEFKMYKFRTMMVDAEKHTGPVWAAKNDNRLTLMGSFLRKTHVDEIPQLINIFKGEMSLIGPRPERPVFVEQFKEVIPKYAHRLAVKPGLTGLAQVRHRYDETIDDVRKKLKYDLFYIRKMCLWSDLRIFFRTLRVVVAGESAR